MDINFNIGFGKIDSLSWDSTLLKVQFSNGKVIAFENITFSDHIFIVKSVHIMT